MSYFDEYLNLYHIPAEIRYRRHKFNEFNCVSETNAITAGMSKLNNYLDFLK